MSMANILDVVGKVARMEARSAVIRGPWSDKAPDSASLHPGYLDRPCLPSDYGAPKGALKTPGGTRGETAGGETAGRVTAE
jgi:hypothetical protein